MSTHMGDNLAAIERVRIEADRLTLACSAISGAVPVALGVAMVATISKVPPDIQRELDRTKGIRQ